MRAKTFTRVSGHLWKNAPRDGCPVSCRRGKRKKQSIRINDFISHRSNKWRGYYEHAGTVTRETLFFTFCSAPGKAQHIDRDAFPRVTPSPQFPVLLAIPICPCLQGTDSYRMHVEDKGLRQITSGKHIVCERTPVSLWTEQNSDTLVSPTNQRDIIPTDEQKLIQLKEDLNGRNISSSTSQDWVSLCGVSGCCSYAR